MSGKLSSRKAFEMSFLLTITTKWRRIRAGMPTGKLVPSGANRSIWLRFLFAAVCMVSFAPGCGVAADAGNSLLGRAEEPAAVISIIISLDGLPLAEIVDRTESVVARSAVSGDRISVSVLSGGNASTARAVDLSEVHDGDLQHRARNDFGRKQESERNTRAVMTAIGAEITALARAGPARGDTGNDLFGAIRRAAMSPATPDRVTLITFGAVHRTAGLDLLKGYRDVPELVQAIPEVRAPGTDLIVLGVADFSGAETIPSIAFTDAVTELWEAACGVWVLRSCTLATDPAVLDELQADPQSSAPADRASLAGPALAAAPASAAGLALAAGLVLALCLALAPRWATRARRIAIVVIAVAVCLIVVGCGASRAVESRATTLEAGTPDSVTWGASLPAAEVLGGEIPGIEVFVPATGDAGLEAEPSPAGAPAHADASEALARPAPPRPDEPEAAAPPPSKSPEAEPRAAESPAAEPPPTAPTPPPPDPEPATLDHAASQVPEPDDEPPEPPRSACQGFRVSDVLFESGTATLAAAAADSLKALVQRIPGGVEIRIVGHTDDVPIAMGNDSLSALRAHAVASALVEAGLDPADISEIVGKGDSEPVAGNDSTEGRRQNRRVEILVSCPAEPRASSAGGLSPAASACDSPVGCRGDVNPDGVWAALIFPLRRFLSRRPRRGPKPPLPPRNGRASDGPTCPDGWDYLRWLQVVARALDRAFRKLRGARAFLLKQFPHLDLDIAHGEHGVARAEAELVDAREAARGQRPPQRSTWLTASINLALFVGDIAVVSAALLAHNPEMGPVEGYVTALAISATLVVFGCVLGEQLHPERRGIRLRWPVMSTLVIIGVALYLLRQNVSTTWVFLSIVPALGAAANKATGRTAEQREIAQQERALRAAESRLVQALARRDRTAGKASELDQQATLRLMREVLIARTQLMPRRLERPFPSVAGMIDETEIRERLEQMAADPDGAPADFDRSAVHLVDRAIRSGIRPPAEDAATEGEADSEPASNGSGQPQSQGSPADRPQSGGDPADRGSPCRVCGRAH